MSLRSLFRARPLPHMKSPKPTNLLLRPQLQPRPRFQSTSSATTSTNPKAARLDRILSRLPKFLRPWTNGLRSAPGANVVAFLVLHEITAIVPLVGLAGLFHWSGWLPTVRLPINFLSCCILLFHLVVERTKNAWADYSCARSTGQKPNT
jgi:hypothetical protein